MRRLPLAGLAAVLAAVFLVGCSSGKDAVATGGDFQFVAPGGQEIIHYEPPEARGTLRRFSGESLTEPGRQIGIQDYPNQVVVLNIWSSWCGPCRAEMGDLQVVQDKLAGQGVEVLGINIRDDRAAAADFARSVKVTYPSIFDPPGRALLGLNGYPRNVEPSTIVLDRQHRVAAVYLARIRLAELTGVLQRIADETSA